MGNQQILMVVLGTIVVAIAIAVGIVQFRASIADQFGDEIQATLLNIVAELKEYSSKSVSFGGGGGSFSGFQLSKKLNSRPEVSYSLARITDDDRQLVLLGKYVGSGTDRSPEGRLTAIVSLVPGGIEIKWLGGGAYANRSRSDVQTL